jgi:hypothetical protein
MLAAILFGVLVGQPVAQCHAAQLLPGQHERWPVKVGNLLSSIPANAPPVGYASLAQLDMVPGVCKNDSRYQAALLPGTVKHAGHKEGDVVRVQGWLQLVAHEGDGDYHLQITQAKAPRKAPCVIVEIPDPAQAPTPQLKTAFANARARLDNLGGHKLGVGEKRTLPTPVLVEIEGQLFYDDAHVGKGGKPEPRGKAVAVGAQEPASTLWELHPVTAIKAVGVP